MLQIFKIVNQHILIEENNKTKQMNKKEQAFDGPSPIV